MTAKRRNLIISPIGDDSVHTSWLSQPALRSFDLFLIYYGQRDDFGRGDATHYLRRTGFKWELIDHVCQHHADVLDGYANIWCPDNDIRADTASVNRLFELFERYSLQLAQPAIAAGQVSYQTLRQRAGVLLRYSPYVEVMCPLFTREALRRCQPTLLESRSGWGLDWVWPRYFSQHEIAIIDAVGVEHTGPLGQGENYQRLAELGVYPDREFHQVMAKFGGFDRRLHKKFVRGRIKLPAILEPGQHQNFFERLKNRLGWRRVAA
ncbi:MAG: DUF707 domain-containing protein [Pirellulales bacterium]